MATVLAPQSFVLASFDRGQAPRGRTSLAATVDVATFGAFRLFAGANLPQSGANRYRVHVRNNLLRNRSVSVEGHKGQWLKRRAQMDQTIGNRAMEEANEDDETCEIGYMVQAMKNNNGAALLFLTDVYGFEDSDTRDFAYRLACFGYNVLVPDLFRGSPRQKESSMDDYEKWREQQPPERVAGDIDVATKWLANEVPGWKLGVIGFCYGGGRLIERLARNEDNLFSAAAFCYGTRFDTSLVQQIKIPLLIIAGDGDQLCPLSKVREMEQFAKEGTKVKIYPGFGHGFVHRPNSSEADEASEDAFTEIRHWFHQALISSTE